MNADRMILGAGQDVIFSTDCEQTGLNNNVIVCASSGSGKTMSIIEPRLLETFNSSLIVTVTKRRIVEKYREVFLSRGYDVFDLNFAKPEESTIAYDPLAYIAGYSDIVYLAESIVKADPRKRRSHEDPFWDNAAISLLSTLIAYVLMAEESPTFADVLKLNDSIYIEESRYDGIKTSIDDAFKDLSKRDPDCFALTCWNTFRVLPFKTASSVCGTLNTTLDTIFTPELRKLISVRQKLDFKELALHKTVLFVSTSAVNPILNCFVNMFYSQMFKQLFEFSEELPNGRLPVPVSVLADDFATGSKIINFPEYISVFREKQISVMILLQSESQLERMYGHEDAITIIDNCDTYVYMGGMNIQTCRNISERLNVPIEDIFYMPLGQEIIFRRGQRPIVTKRYNILENEKYRKITEEYEKKLGIGAERLEQYLLETSLLEQKREDFLREIRKPMEIEIIREDDEKHSDKIDFVEEKAVK